MRILIYIRVSTEDQAKEGYSKESMWNLLLSAKVLRHLGSIVMVE